MGTISLQIPQSGLPNSTEDPKIASDLGVLQTLLNGNVDTNNLAPAAEIADTQLGAPASALRRLLLQGSVIVPAGTAGPVICLASGAGATSGQSVSVPAILWAGDVGLSSQPQDFQLSGRTAEGRIRACVANNGVSAFSATFGLVKVTAAAGSGGALAYTFAVPGVGATTPVTFQPGTIGAVESAQFALPADSGIYALYASGVPAGAGAAYTTTIQLYGYNS